MKHNRLYKYAQAGAVAGIAAKKLGLEGIEKLTGVAAKAAAESAATTLSKQMGAKLVSQLPKVAGKGTGEVAELIASKIESKIASGALQSAKESSEQIAKQIVKELEKDGIKTTPQLIEEALLNARGVDVLKRLATAFENGTEKEFLKKLTSQELPALRNTMMNAIKAEGAPTEIKQMFVTLLNESPKFSSSIYANQAMQAAIPGLKVFFKATTDPIGLLSQKLTKYPEVSKWLAERTVARVGTGIFAATTTFGLLKNMSEMLFSNFSNLQDIVSTINSNLRSYDFAEPNWEKLVAGFEKWLNDGLKEHNEAKMIQFTQGDSEVSVKEKTDTLLKNTATGDDKLRKCFNALSSKEFRAMFDAVSATESSKIGELADTALNIAEKTTPVDIRNITIIQDAAKRGLKLLETNDANLDKMFANLDKSFTQNASNVTGKNVQTQNPMSMATLGKIINNYIKVSSMLIKIRK